MIKPRETLEKVVPYFVPDIKRRDFIRLDLNENNIGCSPRILEFLKSCSYDALSMYADYDLLYDVVCKKYGISKDNVIFSNGADDSLRIIFATYGKENEILLTLFPTYSMYKIFADIIGMKTVTIEYNQDFSFPENAFFEAIKHYKPSIIAIANPPNPIGFYLSEKFIRKIIEFASDSVVIIDETYIDFAGDSFVPLIKDYNNVFVVYTLSKLHALAGLRIGFTFSDKNNIQNLSKINLPYALNSIAVNAAIISLEDTEHIKYIKDYVNKEKEFFMQKLKDYGVVISDANFILLKSSKFSDVIMKEFYKNSILIKKINYDCLFKNYLRITISTHEINQKVVDIIKGVFEYGRR